MHVLEIYLSHTLGICWRKKTFLFMFALNVPNAYCFENKMSQKNVLMSAEQQNSILYTV